jgi:hypothetical protein
MNVLRVLSLLGIAVTAACNSGAAERLCDHDVVLDRDGRLLPWTSFDNVLRGSMNYIKHCPTVATTFGNDPWYLVTSKLTEKGEFMRNQNCQGSHAFWGVETLTRYYAYSGDADAIRSIKLILDRVLYYHTSGDWAWPNVPRTQDNSPDGEYTDETGEADKIALVGVAYVKFYKLTGEAKYLQAARGIAQTLASHVTKGDAHKSPLPFRINLKNGNVLNTYTSHMVAPVLFFDEMIRLGEQDNGVIQAKRDLLWKWVLAYPLQTCDWTGYYEDVGSETKSMNQQSPMETARFMLRHTELDPDYKVHVPALLAWVKGTLGQTKRYSATSIREQTCCFFEMSSHTARYASIAAKWFGVTRDPGYREEARASFALASYSAFSKYSQGDNSLNYVGIGYVNPWFTDSYFDYLSHLLEGMSELPEMAPADADHIIGSDSVLRNVAYQPGRIEYTAFEPSGNEILRITFKPQAIMADGKPLASHDWTYGEHLGVPGVLRIRRESSRAIIIIAGK